jgi:hypothetical protein
VPPGFETNVTLNITIVPAQEAFLVECAQQRGRHDEEVVVM